MDIIPFRGYRYNTEVVGDPGRCIAPPYDVIDPEQQSELYDRSPYNIVRITKGKTTPQDNANDNVYTRAAVALRSFLDKKALKPDSKDSIYVYVQDFTVQGQPLRRSGFIALGKLEGYDGSVRAHEQTLAGPKADRLNLMRATKIQTGQVFMLYSDPKRRIDALLDKASQQPPLLTLDDEGVKHRLFAITQPDDIATIVAVMKEQSVFIADGHHRYETACNYYKETGNPAASHHIMTFINTHNEGLVVLPTHRLFKNIANFQPVKLLESLKRHFDIARLAFTDEAAKTNRREMMFKAMALEFEQRLHTFGLYLADRAFYVLTLKDVAPMDTLASDHSPAWRQLDVAILHKLILENLMGIGEAALTAESNLIYIKDIGAATQDAIGRVDIGEAQGLFFMNPTRPEEVAATAAAGEKMPQKSTFFHPKIFSGLVINVLEEKRG